MKKTLIALSFVCAGALAFADNPQYNSGWFSGIGTRATSIEALGASNGTWSGLTVDNASVADGALVLDLDETDAGVAEEATFAIASAADESGTAQTLSVTGIFNPISAGDLLSGAEMNEKSAQVGFAVVGAESEGAMTYTYYAWVGATGGATAAADWVELSELGAVADPEASTALTIELNYWDANAMTATFKVGDKSATKTLTSAAAQNKKIASVSCTGSGTLNALSGAYQYAVAEAEGRKFGTAVEAIAAAQATGGSGNVILRRAVNGEVSFSGYLCVHYDSSVSGLKDNIDANFTVADGSAQTYVMQGGSSRVENGVRKEWMLDPDMLLAVMINEKQIGGGTFGGTLDSDFRDWLLNNCPAYRVADATSGAIQNALLEKGTNGYPLWQSFVMGVDADETVKLAPATTDTETDGISLTLANTIPASPYDRAIKYTVTKKGGTAGTATAITRTSPVVKIPLETGRYSVKFTIGE